MLLSSTSFTQGVKKRSNLNDLKMSPNITYPNKIPLSIYIMVILTPKRPKNNPIATSFTNGDVIKNANVTPRGIPPRTNPINKGTDEQEQNGVTTPNNDGH